MKQYLWHCVRQNLKQNISLLLVLAMLLGAVPQVHAMEAETETVPNAVQETVPETTSEAEQETVPVTGSETVPETVPLTFTQQLLEMALLQDIHDAMMAAPEGVYALTAEEIAAVKAHAQELYNAILEPDESVMEYYELIMGTLEMVEAKADVPVELLEDIPSITQNGSRLILNGADSCQWQRSEDGTTYSDIEGATGKYYDLTTEDSEKYIRAKIAENTYADVQIKGQVVIFDLAKAAVSLGETYSGKDVAGNDVSGSHAAENIYIIQQSNNETLTTNDIKFSGDLEDHPFDVTLDGVHMGNDAVNFYPTKKPEDSGIGGYTTGTIDLVTNTTDKRTVTLRLKGENVVRVIHYYSNGNNSLKITDINGDKATDGGSLYIPVKVEENDIDSFVAQSKSYNHWNSGIGGDDSSYDRVDKFEIAGGFIQVLTTLGDNCTAIGAGGNGKCTMTISGGKVVAHCNGTGAAIGGGIGWHSAGGTSNVTITGGEIYTKNHGYIERTVGNIPSIVGGVAIGSGSSFAASGSKATVSISGGNVEAYGAFGNGIGGGNSSNATGGSAEITISGGTVVANSIGGGNSKNGVGGAATVTISGNANVTLTKGDAGSDLCGIGGGNSETGAGGEATITVEGGTLLSEGSIGGGTGGGTGNGGTATVNVRGGILKAQSIGGGTGSEGGNGGAAKITVSGGQIETGSIGGGTTLNPNGQLGHATAEITGGDISGQFLLKGAAEKCYFHMSGGIVHSVNTGDSSIYNYAMPNGAAVYMDDPNGEVRISGGTIKDCTASNGGAVYMTAGTFTVSGETSITNCTATENGGAVYLGGGTMRVDGGSIMGNNAQVNGGAVYLGGGNLTVSNGEITGNEAKTGSGGGAYVNGGNVEIYGTDTKISDNKAAQNGGGVAVNNGSVEMSGGKVDGNQAISGNGGGIYVSSSGEEVTVDVLSGSVSGNTAGTKGGALAVEGPEEGEIPITVTIGINEDHYEGESLKTDLAHGAHGSFTCPVINDNSAQENGGAVYVTGSKSAKLNMYCLTEKGNKVGAGNSLSDFMMVEGGTVEITTESDGTEETAQTGKKGHTVITSTIYVVGGDMDIWGTMTNPDISEVITVDIKKDGDDFDDHRINGSGGKKYYKLLYFENFTDPITKLTTGQYKEFFIQQGNTEKIKDILYAHTGYQIQGWNTKPDQSDTKFASHQWVEGQEYIINGWYKCNEEYVFDDTHKDANGNTRGDLTLYAIWEPVGYLILFEANAGENEVYSGEMSPLDMQYDVPKNLTQNAFGRKGYYFKNWNTMPDGSGTSYEDGAEVNNLSNEVGKPVTLYAQWIPCDHDPEKHEYTYIAKDGVLTGECPCGGCTVTATLTAKDTVYNMQVQEAELDVSVSGVNVEQVKEPAISITYEKKGTDDSWIPLEAGKKPINAGEYKASIGVGDIIAWVEYAIEKAEQPAPERPKYEAQIKETESSLVLKHVTESSLKTKDSQGYDCIRQYMVAYDDGSGNIIETLWTPEWSENAQESDTAPSFTMPVALTNYYVYARYSEGTNYLASEATRADTEYFFVGNVHIIVTGGEGISYEVKKASENENVVTGVELVLNVEEGYYFPADYNVTKNNCTVVTNGGSEDTLTIIKNATEANNAKKVYDFNNIPSDCTITIRLPDAIPLPSIMGYITEGQVFGNFTDLDASVSRDSAYTARFVVKHFDPAVYSGQITFDAQLPQDTSLILMKKTSDTTTYYRANSSGNKIDLVSFLEMGKDNTQFALTDNEQDVTLQLVANVNGAALSGETLRTSLVLTPKEQEAASEVTCSVTASLTDQAKFSLAASEDTVTMNYQPSAGVASIWNGREHALVLQAASGEALPKDAQLHYVYGGENYDCVANPQGEFIIPLGSLGAALQPVKFTLSTGMESGSYAMDVAWYVANSRAETSPLNGAQQGTEKITLASVRSDVSLKVTAAEHLYSPGSKLTANISVKNIQGYTVKLEVQKKTDEGYQSTGHVSTITGNTQMEIALGSEPGSYRLYLYAYTGYGREETCFYYIIQ